MIMILHFSFCVYFFPCVEDGVNKSQTHTRTRTQSSKCVYVTFQIEILVRDTKRQEFNSQQAVLKLWTERVVGLIGSSSSNPTAAIATIAGLPIVNLALVGFHAGSPTLSDPKKYPTFVRVNPIVTDTIHAIMSLLQRTFCAFQPTYCC